MYEWGEKRFGLKPENQYNIIIDKNRLQRRTPCQEKRASLHVFPVIYLSLEWATMSSLHGTDSPPWSSVTYVSSIPAHSRNMLHLWLPQEHPKGLICLAYFIYFQNSFHRPYSFCEPQQCDILPWPFPVTPISPKTLLAKPTSEWVRQTVETCRKMLYEDWMNIFEGTKLNQAPLPSSLNIYTVWSLLRCKKPVVCFDWWKGSTHTPLSKIS